MAQTHRRRNTTAGSAASRRTPRRQTAPIVSWDIPWTNFNLIGLAIGVGVILVGYLVMSSGIADDPVTDKSVWNNATSSTVAPIILTIAYCVILPAAIFWRKKQNEEPVSDET